MNKLSMMRLAFEDVSVTETTLLVPLDQHEDGLVTIDESDDLQGAHDDSEKIDELISTTQALEDIEEAVQAASEQDGLGPQTAKALDVAIEQFKLHAGISSEKGLSLEGFQGGRATRVAATRLALEDLGETIRRTVQKIIAFIKHIAQVCYEKIERAINGAHAVIRRSQALDQKAQALAYKRIDRDKLKNIDSPSLVSFFNKNGKPMDATEVVQAFKAYCSQVNASFSAANLFGPSVKALDEMEKFINRQGDEKVDMGAVEGFANVACDSFIAHSLKGYSSRHQEDADLLAHPLPFGNSEMVFNFVHSQNDPAKRIGFRATIRSNNIDTAPALTPMKPQEVMHLLQVLTAEMNKGIYYESKKIRAAIHEVTKRVEKQSVQLSDRQRAAGASSVPTLYLIKLISESSMKITRLLYAYSGISTRRLLSYAQSSLAAYDKASID